MTTPTAGPDDHPWYLDLRPDPASDASDSDAFATLQALEAIGAIVLAVHPAMLPTLADLVAGRGYIGWIIAVPGSVERRMIEDIAAMAGPGYRATIAPGHPLPPVDDQRPLPVTHHRADHHAVPPSVWPQAAAPQPGGTASPSAGAA